MQSTLKRNRSKEDLQVTTPSLTSKKGFCYHSSDRCMLRPRNLSRPTFGRQPENACQRGLAVFAMENDLQKPFKIYCSSHHKTVFVNFEVAEYFFL